MGEREPRVSTEQFIFLREQGAAGETNEANILLKSVYRKEMEEESK